MRENDILKIEQINYKFMKYENIFNNHKLRMEQQEEKSKYFLCYCEENFEYWYRVVFEQYRIILHADFDHFILRVNEKDSLNWLINIYNSKSKKDFEAILKKIPDEHFSEYIEFSASKGKHLLEQLEKNAENILFDYVISAVKKNSYYYHVKDRIKTDLSNIRYEIKGLKKELKKISSKEFCENYNSIIDNYNYNQLGFKVSSFDVDKYTRKCQLNLAALFKFSELYCEKYFNNLVAV